MTAVVVTTIGNVVQPAPTVSTLKKYGLVLDDWPRLLAEAGHQCPICRRRWPEVRLVIDHEHVERWRFLVPEERRKFVRGVVCVRCNMRFLVPGMTASIAVRMGTYLIQYGQRRPANYTPPPRKKKRRRYK